MLRPLLSFCECFWVDLTVVEDLRGILPVVPLRWCRVERWMHCEWRYTGVELRYKLQMIWNLCRIHEIWRSHSVLIKIRVNFCVDVDFIPNSPQFRFVLYRFDLLLAVSFKFCLRHDFYIRPVRSIPGCFTTACSIVIRLVVARFCFYPQFLLNQNKSVKNKIFSNGLIVYHHFRWRLVQIRRYNSNWTWTCWLSLQMWIPSSITISSSATSSSCCVRKTTVAPKISSIELLLLGGKISQRWNLLVIRGTLLLRTVLGIPTAVE